jgi:excisionase family DNA binding protein
LKEVALTDRLALSVIEASALAGVGRSQIYVAISSGALAARKRGRSPLILPADLRAWMNALPVYTPSKVAVNNCPGKGPAAAGGSAQSQSRKPPRAGCGRIVT